MKTMTLSLLLLLAVGAMAQEEAVDEMIIPAPSRTKPPARLIAPQIPATRVVLPATVTPVVQPDGENPITGREEVGYVLPFDPNWLPSYPWQQLPDGGRIARIELHSQGAMGLRVQFLGFFDVEGLELRVYDPAGTAVLGPYSAPRLSEDFTWWAPIIFGETIGLEFYLPPDTPAPRSMPQISRIAYIHCACHSTFPPGTPLSCHNDISCFSSWKNLQGRAVACIYFTSNSSCSRCSGALLNRQPNDFSPIFMTANHCISAQSEANSVEAFWLYETTTCNGTAPNINNMPRTDGAIILKRHCDSDWTLLGLYEPPVGDVYLGWTTTASWSSDSVTGIHHPRGSFKRISFGTHTGSTNNLSVSGIPCNIDVWDISYTNGIIQPGSSGSPLFDSTPQVRGVASAIDSQVCPTQNAFYGRLDLAYTNLKYYMGDSYIPTPVYVDGSVAGDPANNGDTERGTSADPFNEVYEASFCVRAGDEVHIVPGNYDEQFTIWRPMTLKKKSGTSGSVIIGRP